MIALDKPMTAPNGAPVAYHVVRRCEIGPDADAVTLFVASYSNRQAFHDGSEPLAYAAPRVTFAKLASCAGFMDDIIEAVTAVGIFEGAVPSLSSEATEAEQLEHARRVALARRDQLLSASDWRVIRAVDTGVPMCEAWQQYRQALRDLPEQDGFPTTITWPTLPEVA